MEGTPGIEVQRVVRAPEGITESLAFIGLGSQVTRAALVSTLATSIAYASKYPKHAFTLEARGTCAPAGLLLVEGISRCCGTRTSMAAHGTCAPALRLLAEGISRCCGTYTSMAAHGTRKPALRLLAEGISRCSDMRTSMAARGTSTPSNPSYSFSRRP
jgi:hypothetical protein